MKIKVKKIPTSIPNLYDIIAEQLGYDPDKCHYSCTQIEVSEDIYNTIEATYGGKDVFAMHWLIYGPKVDEDLEENTARIHEDFIEEEQE